jgi:excisionase family DNA binding protein
MTPLLCLKEVGRLLGVSLWTVRRLIQDGTLTPVRVGSRVLLEQATLEDFIAAQRGTGRNQ